MLSFEKKVQFVKIKNYFAPIHQTHVVYLSVLSPYSDADLLPLLKRGDHAAFEEIWERYWQLGYNTAYKRLRNEEESQDAVQDIFTDLWLRRGNLEIKNLPAYIKSAVQYRVYKILEKASPQTPFYELFESMAATAVGADSKIVEKELMALAKAWLDSLPEKRRKILLLHYSENLSTKEISVRMNISQKTVQNQLGLATNALHERLRPVYLLLLSLKMPIS